MSLTPKDFLAFVVAEFPSEDPVTVEAIPSLWVSDSTSCKYPSGRISQTALRRLLKDKFSKPQDDWGTNRCRILGTFGEDSLFH